MSTVRRDTGVNKPTERTTAVHRHLKRLLLAAGITLAALVAAAIPSPAAAQIGDLSAETLLAIWVTEPAFSFNGGSQAPPPSICDPSGNSTIYFSAAGTANGPYPGTFTETGTITLGPQNLAAVPPDASGTGLSGTVLTFETQFEIRSGATTITGTSTLSGIAYGAPFDSTATCASFEDATYLGTFRNANLATISGTNYFARVAAAYSATIDDGVTTTHDAGETIIEFEETFFTGATCLPGTTCIIGTAGASPFEQSFLSTGTLEPPTASDDCKVTYGGWVNAQNGDRGSFSGQAQSTSTTAPSGKQSYRDSGPAADFDFVSTETTAVTCTADSVQIYGRGTVNGGSPVTFRIDLTDGGRDDTYRIVWAGAAPYDSGVQPLRGGNITVH
jgi:hypothetical protein